MKEQRSFTRVPFQAEVLVNVNGERYRGKTDNLSLYGLFVQLQYKPDLETEVEVTIPIADQSEERYVGVSGTIARQDGNGVGIRFQQLDVDTFIEIKNIVTSCSGNEAKIMDEFFNYITYRESPSA